MKRISWKGPLKFGRGRVSAVWFQKHIDKENKCDEVQLIWRTSVQCVGYMPGVVATLARDDRAHFLYFLVKLCRKYDM